MHVKVTRVGETLYEGEAKELLVPGIEGDMTILPHHEALVSPLRAGKVTVRNDEEKTFEIEKGILEVSNNQAIGVAVESLIDIKKC